MNKEQAIKEWQYGIQTQPCNDYAPDTLAPETPDQEICTTCYHHKKDHMKMPDIITRLNVAANIMREYAQYSDDEFEHNGEGDAAVDCDDAAALIKYLVATLEEVKQWTLDDETIIHENGNATTIDGKLFLDLDTLNERFQTVRDALERVK